MPDLLAQAAYTGPRPLSPWDAEQAARVAVVAPLVRHGMSVYTAFILNNSTHGSVARSWALRVVSPTVMERELRERHAIP